ncbi:hypothetical protein, partial [Bifidobacterium avesanii]
GGDWTGNQKTCLNKQYKHALEFSNHAHINTLHQIHDFESDRSAERQQMANLHEPVHLRKSAYKEEPQTVGNTANHRRVGTVRQLPISSLSPPASPLGKRI